MWNSIEELQSSDTDVKKYIFKKDDAIAEAVLYKYGTYEERTVMCISTQTGCEMGCTFCGTGKFFGRDLTAAEIQSQVNHMMIAHPEIVTSKNIQIMVMSMGEPLMNMLHLERAFQYFDKHYPIAKLLVSTSAPRTITGWYHMMEMARINENIGLQFSVHASTDTERDKIMPMKAKLNLEQIALKGLEFYRVTGRKPYFNYCVTKDNANFTDIDNLRMLFDPRVWEATLSVVCASDETMKDAHDKYLHTVNRFSQELVNVGFNTRVFDPAGQDDIGGGCGQLFAVQKWAKENPHVMTKSAGAKIACKSL